MTTLLASATVLASDIELDSDTVTPGVLGFLVVLGIAVGLYFLMRSLLGKLRALSNDGGDGTAEASASAEGTPVEDAPDVKAVAEDAPEDTAPRT